MHAILLVIGAFMAIVGAVLIRYGVPLDEYGNSPLLVSGMVALVGGLLLIALFLVARNLNRIAERLEIHPLPLPPIADIARMDPPPRPTAPPPAVKPEPPLMPEVAAPEPKVEPRIEPRAEPVAASAAAPGKPAAASKSLFGLFGSKRTPVVVDRKDAAAQPGDPARVDLEPRAPERDATLPPRASPAPPGTGVSPARAAEPPAGSAEVYKSGVIDGMAYTLYTDGSIEAELPQGTIRFATVEALQTYLTGRSA
jgi:hypothetical protein